MGTGVILAIVGGAVAVLVLIVVVVVVVAASGSEEEGPGGLAAPPYTADQVPKGPIVKAIPAGCGVSSSTVSSLAPDGRRSDINSGSRITCSWRSNSLARFDGGSMRNLEVEVQKQEARYDEPPLAAAMTAFSREVDYSRRTSTSGQAPKIQELTGLGDEAATWFAVDSYDRAQSTLLVRTGTAVIKVEYGGADYSKKKKKESLVSESSARSGAVKAATDIAKSLGIQISSAPKVTTQKATAPPYQQTPKPCDAVQAKTVDKLAKGTTRSSMGVTSLFTGVDGAQSDECRWSGYSPRKSLEVAIASVADQSSPGSGTATVTREFLKMYVKARDAEAASSAEQKTFSALTGPGDQAYAVYAKERYGTEMTGTVVFRIRNVLVQVSYAGEKDGKPYSKDLALGGAYTTAKEVAEALPK